MGRSPISAKSEDVGLIKKGPWSREEDKKLIDYIEKHGQGSWQSLPRKAGLNRCGKSCRLRWTNYLRPDIKRGNFSPQEEQTIIDLHSILGNKWAMIATHLPGRTDNEIKNYWNTSIRKKLLKSGIDPTTHELIPTYNLNYLNINALENMAKIRLLSHILQILSTNRASPTFLGGSEVLNQFDDGLNFDRILNPLQVPHEISSGDEGNLTANCEGELFLNKGYDEGSDSSFWENIFNQSFQVASDM